MSIGREARSAGLFPAQWLQGDYEPRVHAYYFKQWRQFEMAFHRHDSIEIMYVMSGVCRVELEPDPADGAPRSIAMKRGDFVILNANVAHRLLVDGVCRMLNVEFGRGERMGAAPSLKALSAEDAALLEMVRSPRPYASLRDPEEVYHALKSLVLELDAGGMEGSALSRLLLAHLLLKIARLWKESRGSGASAAGMYVRASIEFLYQNYDRELQAKDVAAAVNLHPGYLQRLFKSQTGQTLASYLTALRMEKAKMLLRSTDIPVSDISDYVGIGSRQYFHALFKKHAGHTPVDYRRLMDAHRWTPE